MRVRTLRARPPLPLSAGLSISSISMACSGILITPDSPASSLGEGAAGTGWSIRPSPSPPVFGMEQLAFFRLPGPPVHIIPTILTLQHSRLAAQGLDKVEPRCRCTYANGAPRHDARTLRTAGARSFQQQLQIRRLSRGNCVSFGTAGADLRSLMKCSRGGLSRGRS